MKRALIWFDRLFWLVLALLLGVLAVGYFGLVSDSNLLTLPGDASSEIKAIWILSGILGVVGLLVLLWDLVVVVRELRGAEKLRSIFNTAAPRQLPQSFGSKGTAASRVGQELRSEEPRLMSGTSQPTTLLASSSRQIRLELSGLGSTCRAIAAVLLLLAVLGTFAGMRQAIPGLVSSIEGVAAGPGAVAQPDFDQLASALDEVGASFGANFLALLGAVVLGIGAFGATRARAGIISDLSGTARRRLRALPLPELGGADLGAAVRSVQAAAEAVAGTKGSIERLDTSLRGFQTDLADALTKLGSNISRTLEVRLNERVVEALQSVTKQFGEVASAVSATAVAYEGLVSDQDRRTEALKSTTESLVKACEGATASIDRSVVESTRSLDSFRDAIEHAEVEAGRIVAGEVHRLAASANEMTDAIEGLGGGVSSAAQELSASVGSMTTVADNLRDAATEQRQAIEELGQVTGPYVKRLDAAIKSLGEVSKSTEAGVERLLDKGAVTSQTAKEEFASLRSEVARDLEHLREQVASDAQALRVALDAYRATLGKPIDQPRMTVDLSDEAMRELRKLRPRRWWSLFRREG